MPTCGGGGEGGGGGGTVFLQLMQELSLANLECNRFHQRITVFTRLQARATNSFAKILTLPLFEVGVNLRQVFIN